MDPGRLNLLLSRHYDLPPVTGIRSLRRGQNQSLLLETAAGRWVARFVRPESDLEAEAGLRLHLAEEGVPVQLPVLRRDGACCTQLPGGELLGVFEYIPGEALFIGPARAMTPGQAGRFGAVLVQLHSAAQSFRAPIKKTPLGPPLFFETESHLRALPHNYGPGETLLAVVQAVRERINGLALPLGPPFYGLCHGDYFPGNAIWQAERCVLIDFEFAAPGFRVYDLAVFRYCLLTRVQDDRKREDLWRAFLAGYETGRALAPEEQAALPLYSAINGVHLLRLRLEAIRDGQLPPLDASALATRLAVLESLAGR